MNLSTLENKRIAILGLGIENHALVKFLLKKGVDCAITICDARSKEDLGNSYKVLNRSKNVSWKLGQYANKNLDGFDIMFRSPGWPLFDEGAEEAKKMGVELSSPMKLFFELCPTKNIIGVTGTKGKGTTSTLIEAILREARKKVRLGGNIGIAPFDFLEKIKKNSWVVLELSSFQLEDFKVSPHIAVITNFTKEHLSPADPNNPNYHRNMRAYWQAKFNIIKWQKSRDKAVISHTLSSKLKNHDVKSKVIYFSKSDLASKLVGEHNKENIAAAVEVARILKIKDKTIEKAIKKFRGLEHRIEFVKEVRGIKYFEDSFATTPDAAITALKSFSAPIILLAGGADKGSSFRNLARAIKKSVKTLILFEGKATPRIKKELQKINFSNNKIDVVGSMKEAVKLATKNTEKGDIVLLSPACASFGLFKNYKERGDLFKKEVKSIK